MRKLLIAAGLTALGSPASSAVNAVAANGFRSENSVTVAAPLPVVYATFVRPASWWSPQHTWSGDAANLSLALAPGGCFCEHWAGGIAQHMQLTHLEPNKVIVLSGALGPLGRDGFAGGLVFQFTSDGANTIVRQTYTVGGFPRTDMAKYAASVDRVLSLQMRRLAAVAEGRNPPSE